MRLPFSITSISSPGSPRSDGERTKLEASEIEFWPTMNDGTMSDRVSSMLAVDWAARSAPLSTSIGADDSVTVRSRRRVPVTITSSASAPAALAPGAPTGWSSAQAICVTAASVDAARKIGKNFIRVLL